MTDPKYVDGCPSCVAVYQPPAETTAAGSGVVCTYRCAGCGHEWQTSWAVNGEETTVPVLNVVAEPSDLRDDPTPISRIRLPIRPASRRSENRRADR